MHANTQTSAAEMILQRRWRELQQSQQQAAADECQMAEGVLSPQPGALPLAGDLSLTELADFVPSGIGIEGQYEQALHQFAVMSFRWGVRNLMAAAQTEDPGLRDTHRELANWYAKRSAKLTRALQQFRKVTTKLQLEVGCAANGAVDSSVPCNANVGLGDMSALAAMNVFVAHTVELNCEIEAAGTRPTPPAEVDANEPLTEPIRSVFLPARSRKRW